MSALPSDTLFRCPHCHAALTGSDDGYRCAGGHSFDAREGVPDLVPESLRDESWTIWEEHLAAFQRRREQRVERPEDITARITSRGDQQQAFADFIGGVGDAVLDIGCGPGKFRRQLGPETRYLGIDPIPLLPDVSGFEFARAVSELLPFEDDTFSDVVILHAIDHVKDVAATLSEVARVLSPGGRLHVLQNVLDKSSPVRWVAHEVKDFLEDRRDPDRDDETPHHMEEFTSKTLRATLSTTFRITSEQYWAPDFFSPRRLMVTAVPR